MFGRRFRILTAISVLALAVPASASAANHYTVASPPNGGVVSAVPASPVINLVGGWQFSTAPQCDYDGTVALDADAGGPCFGPHMRPSVDGVYTLNLAVQVEQTNNTNQQADNSTVSFELDSTPPAVTIDPLSGGWSKVSQPTLSFSAFDANLTTVQCRIGGAFGPCTSSTSFVPASPLADQLTSHTFEVKATDAAGNTYTASYNFFVDTVAPIVNVIYPTPGAVVDSSVPEVNLSIDGATAGTFCKFDDQAFQSCGAAWLGGTLADGAHTLTVRGVDLAGNETVVVVPFKVDDALGATPVPVETSITGGRGGKVKAGKFKVKAGFSLLGPEGADPAVVCGATVTATLKPKGGRAYKDRVRLMNKSGRCVASATFTVPKRFKGKRAKLTFHYPGTPALGAVTRAKTIKKL